MLHQDGAIKNHDFKIRIIYLPVNPLVVDANALHQPRHGIFFVLAVAALRPQRQPRLGIPRDRIVGAVVVKVPEVTEGRKLLEGRRTFADLHGPPASGQFHCICFVGEERQDDWT